MAHSVQDVVSDLRKGANDDKHHPRNPDHDERAEQIPQAWMYPYECRGREPGDSEARELDAIGDDEPGDDG